MCNVWAAGAQLYRRALTEKKPYRMRKKYHPLRNRKRRNSMVFMVLQVRIGHQDGGDRRIEALWRSGDDDARQFVRVSRDRWVSESCDP